MRLRQTWALTGAVFALAACGASDGADGAAASASGSTKDANTSSSASPGRQQAGIPAPLHGKWALDAADCAKLKDAATGVMTVAADELRFHESRARPSGGVLAATAESFDAEFTFEGEGQVWKSRQRLRRLGDELLRTDGSQTESIPYVRCS